MTTLILHKRKLHGDRKITTDGIFIDSPKIYLHPSKKFAVAIAGTSSEEGEVSRIMDFVFTMLDKHYNQNSDVTNADNIPFNLIFQSMLVLTHDKSFDTTARMGARTNSDFGHFSLRLIGSDDIKVIGTGETIVRFCLREKKTIKETYQYLAKLDKYTGSKFDTIRAKDLIPWDTKDAANNS